jgi:DNA-binding response OmpR family regulator
VNAPIASPGRLLAIDDNADSAELIARVAGKIGYESKTLADLRGLPRILREFKPQVVTLDLCMPQEDGIEILSQLKDNGFNGALLIVSGQEDWLREAATRLATARGLNVLGDLAKPVDIKTLRVMLSGLHTDSNEASQPASGFRRHSAPP